MSVVKNLFSEQCYDTYFIDHDIFNAECAKTLFSKLLGLLLISMSLVIKVPQIKKLWQSQTAEGVVLKSVFLELFVVTLHVAYCFVKGFPLTAWGDVTFIGIQIIIVAFLVLLFEHGKAQAIQYMGIYFAVTLVLISRLTPMWILESLQVLKIPILLGSRFSQAKTNYINKSTGQLSATSCFIGLFATAARIYTSVQETGDVLMIITSVLNTLSIGVIAVQLVYYSNAKSDNEKKRN